MIDPRNFQPHIPTSLSVILLLLVLAMGWSVLLTRYMRAFLLNRPWGRPIVVRALELLPNWIAVPQSRYVAPYLTPHTDDAACLACRAMAIATHAAHSYTEGPRSVYCRKCGLDYIDWPKYCANKTVRINNPSPKRRTRRVIAEVFNQ